MATKPFASSADTAEKEQTLEILADGVYALLESYHDERHAAAVENLAVTTSTMDFLVPRDEERRAYRRMMLDRAVTDASARTKIDSGRLSEPFWYTASPLTTPDPGRPFGGRPARGAVPRPGPSVLVPDALVAAVLLRPGVAELTSALARALATHM